MAHNINQTAINSPLSWEIVFDQLACPSCHGEVRMDAARLVCSECGRAYPVVDGIPVLIPEETKLLEP